MFRYCRCSSCKPDGLAMSKHMFINANIMIFFKIFSTEGFFEQEAAFQVVKRWTQSRQLPHRTQNDFCSLILQLTEIDHNVYLISLDV
ncbi:hypothetical protein D3C71_1032320 [compost metagenome]